MSRELNLEILNIALYAEENWRNNHDKILPIFKDERIRDTFSNVYGKRLRTLE